MTSPTDRTLLTQQHLIQCPDCGRYSPTEYAYCPKCGSNLAARSTLTVTVPQESGEITVPLQQKRQDRFDPRAHLFLHFVSHGQGVSLPLDSPVILGRRSSTSSTMTDLFDLTKFDGFEQGVSRLHCKLERRDTRLLVTDLDSTNGSFLNGMRLAPGQEYVVAHDDHLNLGKLNVVLSFSTMESDD